MEDHKFYLKSQLLKQSSIDVVERYLENKTEKRWQAWNEQLGAEKFFLPIFGVQGSGKSTLLNALFFNDRVLPTDAQETTCVPAELHYNPELTGQAKVCFKDGKHKYVDATEKVLAKYIDNVSNPGNIKGVEIIEVFSNDEALKNGLVVVDLPGYGSLTLANQQTTMNYLSKSSGVIFLIRSVPPLTRGEIYWIKIVWPLLPQATFCQSCWDTETSEEIEDARDHNLSVLVNERKLIWGDDFEDPKLLCVNGEGALKASFISDQSNYEECGAALLKDTISKYSINWRELTVSEITKYFRNDIEKTIGILNDRMDLLRSNSQSLEEAISREKDLFIEYKERVSVKTDGAKEKIALFLNDVIQEVCTNLKNDEMSFRNNMRSKFRAGIVDGERLNLAFQAECSDIIEQIYFQIQDQITILQGELRSQLDGIEEWSSEFKSTAYGFNTQEKMKFENILPRFGDVVGGVGGSIGGSIAGTAAAGALAGTKFGAALGSTLGPAGAIVGAVVGAAIGGLIIGWIGRGGKKLVLNKRIAKIEPQVFSQVAKAIESIRKEILEFVKDFTNDMNGQIDSWLQNQQDLYDIQLKKQLGIRGLEKEEKDHEMGIVNTEKSALKTILTELEGL